MGEIRNYIISVMVAIMLCGTLYVSLYSASTAPDKVDVNTPALNASAAATTASLQTLTSNMSQLAQNTIVVDPTNLVDVAQYFGLALAIGGLIVSFVFTMFLSTIQFVLTLLGLVTLLPPPFNIIGVLIEWGIGILTIVLIFAALAAYLKWDL